MSKLCKNFGNESERYNSIMGPTEVARYSYNFQFFPTADRFSSLKGFLFPVHESVPETFFAPDFSYPKEGAIINTA